MSEPVIPERHRVLYQMSEPRSSAGAGIMQLIRELGTDESLVRELAQKLRDIDEEAGHVNRLSPIRQIARSALSRIPAHLRAPETTSTGESSTVLRQKDLK